jgi:hypothetical protein
MFIGMVAFPLFDYYYSIMIRRGDKMYWESQYIGEKQYVEKILEKNLTKFMYKLMIIIHITKYVIR